MTFTIGSLFSGIGGIELGLERAGGFKTVWFVENNIFCQEVLKKHWSEAKIYDDIKNVKWENVERPDILTGGFPCQDISNAGRREGISGKRSSLWKEYHKAICVLRPRVALIENVSALANRGLNVVLADLASCGYDAEWINLSASDVGAWHKRERLFIIAYPSKFGLYSKKDESELEGQGSNELQFGKSRNTTNVVITNSCCGRSDWEQCSEGICQERRIGELVSNSDHAGLEATRTQQQTTKTERCHQNDVADSVSNGSQQEDNSGEAQGKHSNQPECTSERERLTNFRETIGKQQWQTEPDLGGTLDGFSSWLDKNKEEVLNMEIHKQLLIYGTETETRPEKTLQDMQDRIKKEILQWQIRRPQCVLAQETLFTYLRKLKEAHTYQTRIQSSSQKTFEEQMRMLPRNETIMCPPHRPKHTKQQCRKHTDPMQVLSRFLAFNAETAWIKYRNENANTHKFNWESGIARLTHNIQRGEDSHLWKESIKSLGNAVVPQCAQFLAQKIKERVQ